jgi:hypothetical protein
MDELEKSYNKRFKDKEIPNDDFDVDGLWDAVEADLDKESPKGGYRNLKGWWPYGIVLLFLVGMGAYFVLDGDVRESASTSASASSNGKTSTGGESSNDLTGKGLTANSSLISTSTSTATSTPSYGWAGSNGETSTGGESSGQTTSSKTNAQGRKTDEDQELKITNLEKTDMPNQLANDGTAIGKDASADVAQLVQDNAPKRAEETASDITKVTSTTNVETLERITPILEKEVLPQETTNHPAVSGITKIENDSIALKVSDNVTYNPSDKVAVVDSVAQKEIPLPTPATPVKKRDLQWLADVYGGFQKLDASFILPANTAEITATEQGDYGRSYGIQLGLLWKKQWTLQTGLEYQQLWSRFEYNAQSQRDTFVANQLVRVLIDSISGEVLDRFYADTTYAITETHRVIHNNAYTIFQIPLELGWQQTGKRWTYGLSAGATLNIVSAQSGRSLGRESIVTNFSKSEHEELTAFKDIHMGTRISPFIGYRLNSRMTVKVMPQWSWYSGGRAERIKGGVSAYGVNVGFGLRL